MAARLTNSTRLIQALLAAYLLLTASSCTSLRVSPISVTLSAADSLMMTDPQSALDTLLTADSLAVSGLCGRDARTTAF